jgi:hypothetical protein
MRPDEFDEEQRRAFELTFATVRASISAGPEKIKLIFNRVPAPHTGGLLHPRRHHGVTPSLKKNTRIKQYHKKKRALRTAITINNTYDFGIGIRRLKTPSPEMDRTLAGRWMQRSPKATRRPRSAAVEMTREPEVEGSHVEGKGGCSS